MIFVFPHCPVCESKVAEIDNISRLFAYPTEPTFTNNARITILDSGAFGLSLIKQKMTIGYMQKLSKHYEKYHQNDVLCIAPDEFLNPDASMFNFLRWHKLNLFSNVTPVIQAKQKGIVDIEDLYKQAEFYRKYSDTICFSNNGLTSDKAMCIHLDKLFDFLKSLDFKWVHVLGAGWDTKDILGWSQFDGISSIDTIVYYLNKTESQILERIEEIRCLKL